MDYKKLNRLLNETLEGKRDAAFLPVVESIHCMSRPRVYAVLNAVVSSMDAGELYVEVGTYQGGSLVSALLGNQAQAFGVDSFQEFTRTNSFEITQGNLERFRVGDRVKLHNMSYADFFAGLGGEIKIQVYYYDGEHNYEGQLAGMEAAWKYLADDAMILVDDFTYPEVVRAVNQFIANHLGKVKIHFVMSVPENNDPIWWNGCVVLKRI